MYFIIHFDYLACVIILQLIIAATSLWNSLD